MRIRSRTTDRENYRNLHWLVVENGHWAGFTFPDSPTDVRNEVEFRESWIREFHRGSVSEKQRKAALNTTTTFNDIWHDSLFGKCNLAQGEFVNPYNQSIVAGNSPGIPNISEGTRGLTTYSRWWRDRTLVRVATDHGAVPHSIDDAESIFKNEQLPREVSIDRDPFDTDFSIWFLLIDFWDFKKLFKGLLDKKSALLAMRETGIPKDATAAKLHNTNLGVQFGFIPTIRDLQSFITTLKEWKEKYDDVANVVKKRYRFHRKMDLKSLFPDWTEVYSMNESHPGGSVPARIKVTQTTELANWHGMSLYGFQCPEFQGWISRLAQICDSFGVLDPSVIWDAIPFSFVLDWFFSVSSWLHSKRPKLFPATAVIYDYCESVKIVTRRSYSFEETYEVAASSDGFFFRPPPRVFWTDVYTTYVRRRFRPSLEDVKLSTGLKVQKSFVSIKRVGLSSSLIAQRLPR